MRKILILAFILTTLGNAFSQSKDKFIENILGCWTLTNKKMENNNFHDTITFNPDYSFYTKIYKNTTNSGDWKLSGNKMILKSCLHSADNKYKCRDFVWKWNVDRINKDSLIITDIDGENLVYVKLSKISNVIENDLAKIIKDTLYAFWYEHPYSKELKIFPDSSFWYIEEFHSFVPRIKEFSGKIIVVNHSKIILQKDKKTIKAYKKQEGFLIEKRTLKLKGRKLKIRGKTTPHNSTYAQ